MRERSGVSLAVVAVTVVAGCAHRESLPSAREPSPELLAAPRVLGARSEVQSGYATWYGGRFAGHPTASGEVFDPRQMTAAHRSLPFNTWVEVRCVDTGLRVRVRVTDRGPFGHADRIIDLSRAAAEKLGIRARGVAPVELRVVDGP
jgi:rare lipoprotein A